MANILKSNSGRIALRSITQSLVAASTTTTNRSSSLPSRLSSVRFLRDSRGPISRNYEITPPLNWGIVFVPKKTVFVIERFGKYYKTLPSGIHYLVPFVDRIAYVHSLMKDAISIPYTTASTLDSVSFHINGVLFVKIVDPKLASYGVENPLYAAIQLVQTTMRSELYKIDSYNKIRKERDNINKKIAESFNVAAKSWGLQCLEYKINHVFTLPRVTAAMEMEMEMQAEAERKKRAMS